MKDKRTTFDVETLSGDVADLGRDLWKAGLGAIATLEEESSKFYETVIDTSGKRLSEWQEEAAKVLDDLVKRGERAERRGREAVTARVEAVKEEAAAVKEDVAARPKAVAEKVEQRVAEAVEKTLERLDIPTRDEVRTLTKTVERLTQHLAQLTARLEQ